MSAEHAPNTPTTTARKPCPICGQPYSYRFRDRNGIGSQFNVGAEYRHDPPQDPYVYIHEIPLEQGVEVAYERRPDHDLVTDGGTSASGGELEPVMNEAVHNDLTRALRHLGVGRTGRAREAIHRALNRLDDRDVGWQTAVSQRVAYRVLNPTEPLDVICPRCGFKNGEKCHVLDEEGATSETREPHQERVELAGLYNTESGRDEELITDGGRVDRARFQYASLMRQVSECGPDEKDRVVGFHGKCPESTIQKFIVDGEVVPAKYERLEQFEFEERLSNEDLHEWFVENDPFEEWCDEDGFYDPEKAEDELAADGGVVQTKDPHEEPLRVTEADGLHLPDSDIGHEGGLVVRTPGNTQQFNGWRPKGWVPTVLPHHFGESGHNPELSPDRVQLKKYGEEPEVFRVEVRR